MGKYQQWLHHQEIGRRLRDQISTLEHERGRVQQMQPAHPTTLPDLDNPVIAALISYTSAGHRLSSIDVIQAAVPDIGRVSAQPRQSAPSAVEPSASVAATATTAPASDDALVASLLARAEAMPADPLAQMTELAHATDEDTTKNRTSSSTGAPSDAASSVGDWWQRQRTDDDE